MTNAISESEATENQDEVGSRIRARRKAKRLTLSELSLRTGLSTGYLSQIERGQHSPSVSTLQKVVRALGLEMGDLFTTEWSEESRVKSFHSGEAVRFGIGAKKLRLTPTSFQSVEVFIAVLEPGASTSETPYVHGDSEEIIMVLRGQAVVHMAGVAHVVREHEFIHFHSDTPHRVVATDQEAEILWTIAPPSY